MNNYRNKMQVKFKISFVQFNIPNQKCKTTRRRFVSEMQEEGKIGVEYR